jgi:hypothetical protein
MYEPKVTEAEKIKNLLDTMAAMQYVGERLQFLAQMSDSAAMSKANDTLKGLVGHLVHDCIDAMPEHDFPHALSSTAVDEMDGNVKDFSTHIAKAIVDRIATAEVPTITRD